MIRSYEDHTWSWKCHACSSSDWPYISETDAEEALEAHEQNCEEFK